MVGGSDRPPAEAGSDQLGIRQEAVRARNAAEPQPSGNLTLAGVVPGSRHKEWCVRLFTRPWKRTTERGTYQRDDGRSPPSDAPVLGQSLTYTFLLRCDPRNYK